MSDGSSGGVGQLIQEAVIKPVVDEVGKGIETGVQSVVSGNMQTKQQQSDAQNPQQKQVEEQKKMGFWRHVLDRYRRIDQEQAQVRAQKQQQQVQQTQVEEQKKEIKQFQVQKKKQSISEEMARSQGERRAGRGNGG
jgi:hypothetical protein